MGIIIKNCNKHVKEKIKNLSPIVLDLLMRFLVRGRLLFNLKTNSKVSGVLERLDELQKVIGWSEERENSGAGVELQEICDCENYTKIEGAGMIMIIIIIIHYLSNNYPL